MNFYTQLLTQIVFFIAYKILSLHKNELNGKKEKDTQKQIFDMFYLEDGTYVIKVRACSNDSNYVKSQFTTITYTKTTINNDEEDENINDENKTGDGIYSVFMINEC